MHSEEVPLTGQKRTNIYAIAMGLSLATAAYCAVTARQLPIHLLFLGLVILALSVLPILNWCRRQEEQIPFFSILSLTVLSSYGLPLLRESASLAIYPQETITRAALAVILFQVSMLLSYAATKQRPRSTRFFTEEVLGGKTNTLLPVGLFIYVLYNYLSLFTTFIPYQFHSIVRAICSGIGLVSIFALARNFGLGRLSTQERRFFLLCTILCIGFTSATLMLVSGISTIVLAIIGYTSGSKRLPVTALCFCIPLIALLHNGKHAMREKYWDSYTSERTIPKLVNLPSFYAEWLRFGTQLHGEKEAKDEGITSKLLDRSSLMQMACLVVDCTPYRQPYLDGETYWEIPGQFVPRILWPNKPVAHSGTNRLSIYYGLQDEESTQWTTIGFGLIAEAYANFGLLGVGCIGAFFGFSYKRLACLTLNSPLLSNGGLLVVMVTAWSFQTEFTLSIWLSSLFQACCAIIIIPMAIRKFFG